MEDVGALLSGGRDDGSESGEDSSAVEGSEAARDFHFDLHHPEVLFGQIVGEGHVEIGHEPQRFGFERLQPVEQIVARALFGASARGGFGFQFGQLAMVGEAEPNRGPIALDEGRDRLGRERRGARFTRRVDGGVGVQKHRAHEFGPGPRVEEPGDWSSRKIWALQNA